jgi:hypothetical protein
LIVRHQSWENRPPFGSEEAGSGLAVPGGPCRCDQLCVGPPDRSKLKGGAGGPQGGMPGMKNGFSGASRGLRDSHESEPIGINPKEACRKEKRPAIVSFKNLEENSSPRP